MSSPKIVILCMENRSFDEYFGTLPGAIGFYDPSAAAAFSQPGFTDVTGKPIASLQPFRMSTYSSSSEWSPGFGHQWAPQQLAWNLGAMNGWSIHAPNLDTLPDGSTKEADGSSTLGYFAANDIPFWWSLANSFLLCDTYHCSVLSGTSPNRCMLMSGTVVDPSAPYPTATPVIAWDPSSNVPFLSNYFQPATALGGINNLVPNSPWYSYAAMLGSSRSWRIYDDAVWHPAWLAWPQPAQGQPVLPPAYTGTNGWPAPSWFNMLDYFQDANPANFPGTPNPITGAATPIGISTDMTSGYYVRTAAEAALSAFEADLAGQNLPDVSWVLPAYILTEHPDWLPTDGELYISRIVNAVINSSYWEAANIVLIITYDENDGHFDHVTPPTSFSNQTFTPNPAPLAGNTAQVSQQPTLPQSGPWEPWVSTPGPNSGPQISGGDPSVTGPVGAGFRVPTFIVSPWTYQAGRSSAILPNAVFDHTSIIQYLEEVTGVPCTNLPADPPRNWRRSTFSSLGGLIDTSKTPVPAAAITGVPSVAQVEAWRNDALTRLFGTNPSTTTPQVALPTPNPLPVQAWPPLQQQCYCIMDKTTFGRDEVDGQRILDGNQTGTVITGPATFPSAFFVVVDGFDPAELNLGPFVPSSPGYLPLTPQIALTMSVGGAPVPSSMMSVTVHPAIPDNAQLPAVPQRFVFPCDIVFPDDSAFAALNAGSPTAIINVNAAFTSRLTFNAPVEQIALVISADPFIQNGAVTYLCPDLRVYTVQAGDQLFGATLPANIGVDNADGALAFIQNVIANLNATGSTYGQVFDTPPANPADPAISTVTLYPYSNGTTGTAIYNFAVLRVGLEGVSDIANNVRVFFRLCPAASTGTAFDPTSLYRSTPLPGDAANYSGAATDSVTGPNPNNATYDPGETWATRVPLLGVLGSAYVTFPFLATPRVTPGQKMTLQPPDWPNTQQIVPDLGGVTNYAYFGCWLDINQTAVQFNPAPPPSGSPDGPFASAQPISMSSIRNQHQCLVAEIAFDPIPIPLGATPGDSDKLAQRNLVVNGGVNG